MEITASAAVRTLMTIAKAKPKTLGRILYRTDKTGHSLLCRLLNAVAHHGPHGSFVLLDTVKLEAGGSLCSFGVQCGEPSESHMRQLQEMLEEFQRTERILKATGALISFVWENPRFSAESLCRCGRNDERKLPLHDPLCPYRIEHHCPVTIAEYRAALGRIQ